jgi:hypothetical protein
MNSQQKFKNNPLVGLMRQPKIYIKLPSEGKFWATGALEPTETGEYPVYSMTAKDELMLKIPDALISGQAIVDVIQHCMPHVKNAWAIPNIDLDIILIALRIATYGEKMRVPVTMKGISEDYEVDLRYIMNDLMNAIRWESVVQINPELVVYVKPTTYKSMSSSAVTTFETQRVIQIASDNTMSAEEKTKTFKEAIDKLNDLTIGLINSSVYKIDYSDGTTEDKVHIKEFLDNADKEIFDQIKHHLEKLRENNNIKPLKVQPTEEMLAAGVANEALEVPLTFDPSTFFV